MTLNVKDKKRVVEWLMMSVILLAGVWVFAPQQREVALFKVSLITTGAWLGYWIDRSLFPYARPHERTGVEFAAAMIRRALIVGACILAAALGA